MKKVILSSFLFFYISSVSYSQSKLPECKPTDKVLYHNCYGKKIYGRNGEYYEAEFKNNLPVGEIKYSNGEKYIGEWNNDKGPHGKGTFTFADGSKQVGIFKNGLLEGDGKSFLSNGKILYDGKYKNGTPDGWGTLYDDEGGNYKSKFKNGLPDGVGLETTPDGQKIVREWKDGKSVEGRKKSRE